MIHLPKELNKGFISNNSLFMETIYFISKNSKLILEFLK